MINKKNILIQMTMDIISEATDLLEEGFGFEIHDFLDPEILSHKTEYKKRMTNYEKIINKFQNNYYTFHGPFFGLNIQSVDKDIANLSTRKIINSLDIATKLNCRKIIFHTGIIPQTINPGNLESITTFQAAFWSELSEKYCIEICIENVWEYEPEIFKKIMEKSNHPRLRMCLDTGHIYAFSRKKDLDFWLNEIGYFISHIHLTDNDKEFDDHKAIGDGSIFNKIIIQKLIDQASNKTFLLEVFTLANFKRSYNFMKKMRLVD